MAFLGGEPEGSDDQSVSPIAAALTLSPDATFCFVGADGIPTSNFTYETVCGALNTLEISQTIALKVLTSRGSAISEIFFTRADNEWTVGVLYRQDDEDCRIVKAVDEKKAKSILKCFIMQKRLPDF